MALPNEYSCQNERLGNRYLQAAYWNFKTAYHLIVHNCNFIDSNFPIEHNNVKKLLNTGVIYILSRSKVGHHPILVINCTILVEKIELEDFALVATFIFDWMIKNMLVPGRIETWIIILDLEDVSLTDVPMDKLKYFMNAVMRNFPTRMHRLVCVNTSWLVRTTFYTVVYPWLDDFIKKKLVMCGDTDSDNFLEFKKLYFNDRALEKKFGG